VKFARHVFDDLVERRLAPVAAILLLALVAVPLVLSKSMPKDTASTAAPSANGADLSVPAMQPVVALATPDGRSHLDHVQALNPFEQRHKFVPKRVRSTTPPGGAPTTGSPQPAPGTTVSPGTSSTSTATTPTTASTPATSAPSTHVHSSPHRHHARPRYVARLVVNFGSIGHAHRQHGFDRLSPLPARGEPVIIYLGLLRDNKTAVFLLSSDAHAEGDGRCVPSPHNCQTVRLRGGQTEFFDVSQSNGSIKQYELDVVKVGRARVASARAAHHALARTSRSGRRALRRDTGFRGTTELHALHYDGRTGHLVRARRTSFSR
jgi:hypothetical protein